MTISDLIDYLQQFPADTRVVLTDDETAPAEEYFVALDVLDYSVGTKGETK